MFEFHTQALSDAAKAYESLQLEQRQEDLLRDLARIVGPKIGMDPFPCRGMWLQAVREWQVAQQKSADSLAHMSPPEREVAARQIRDHFAQIAGAGLRNPEDKGKLEAALNEAFEYYLQEYNQRPKPK
jgi:hypothetical protein